MIIESAFFKAVLYLRENWFPSPQYEKTIDNFLAQGILEELNVRGVLSPQKRIVYEKDYPKTPKLRRCDLYIDLAEIYDNSPWYKHYGMKQFNWIETRLFRDLVGNSELNSSKIVREFLKLSLFIDESTLQRNNGRYLFVVCDKEPSEYLAYKSNNNWLERLFEPGEKTLEIKLEQETPAFRECLGKGFTERYKNFHLKFRALTYSFAPHPPLQTDPGRLYWGYLIRLVDFTVSHETDELIYEDTSSAPWSDSQVETQLRLLTKFLTAQES